MVEGFQLDDLLQGPGTFENWEDIYRNTIKELRDRMQGTGQLPSYDSDARRFLTSVVGVAWMASHQIQRISERMRLPLSVLDNLVKSAETHGKAVARADGFYMANTDPGVPREKGMRTSVVNGEAWTYCFHFYNVLTGPEEAYNRQAGNSWNYYYAMCSALVESYAILFQSLLVPNKPISGESVTGIDPDDTVSPFR